MDPKGQMLMHAYFLYFRFSGFAKPLLTGEIKFKHRRKSLFKNLNIFKTNIANKIYMQRLYLKTAGHSGQSSRYAWSRPISVLNSIFENFFTSVALAETLFLGDRLLHCRRTPFKSCSNVQLGEQPENGC